MNNKLIAAINLDTSKLKAEEFKDKVDRLAVKYAIEGRIANEWTAADMIKDNGVSWISHCPVNHVCVTVWEKGQTQISPYAHTQGPDLEQIITTISIDMLLNDMFVLPEVRKRG